MKSYDLIIIGCSLGGLAATRELLSGIADDCRVPIVLIQHREQRAETSMDNLLRDMLRRFTSRSVEEVEDKTRLKEHCIFLAPADYHLLVEKEYLALSADDPVSYARPSIDVAFDSAARTYGSGVIAVVLTGASRDGADGAASVERRGGLVIIQDPSTAEKDTLPCAALASTRAPKVMPLNEIGPYVSALTKNGGAERAARATS
jgi:two-component system chemotaxis response regulator CheB